jgi:hypothetical protein
VPRLIDPSARLALFAHCSLVVSSAPDETPESLLLDQASMVAARAAARMVAAKEVA